MRLLRDIAVGVIGGAVLGLFIAYSGHHIIVGLWAGLGFGVLLFLSAMAIERTRSQSETIFGPGNVARRRRIKREKNPILSALNKIRRRGNSTPMVTPVNAPVDAIASHEDVLSGVLLRCRTKAVGIDCQVTRIQSGETYSMHGDRFLPRSADSDETIVLFPADFLNAQGALSGRYRVDWRHLSFKMHTPEIAGSHSLVQDLFDLHDGSRDHPWHVLSEWRNGWAEMKLEGLSVEPQSVRVTVSDSQQGRWQTVCNAENGIAVVAFPHDFGGVHSVGGVHKVEWELAVGDSFRKVEESGFRAPMQPIVSFVLPDRPDSAAPGFPHYLQVGQGSDGQGTDHLHISVAPLDPLTDRKRPQQVIHCLRMTNHGEPGEFRAVGYWVDGWGYPEPIDEDGESWSYIWRRPGSTRAEKEPVTVRLGVGETADLYVCRTTLVDGQLLAWPLTERENNPTPWEERNPAKDERHALFVVLLRNGSDAHYHSVFRVSEAGLEPENELLLTALDGGSGS